MKTKQTNQEYNQYVEAVTPKHDCFKNCVNAFIVGGLICTLGQFISNILSSSFDLPKEDAGAWTSIILVLLSVLLTSFNLYKKLAKFGGAGALVPITGFANSVAAPTIEYQKEGEVFGKGVKVFTISGPVILFGILTGWCVGLIYWILTITGIL